MHTPNSNNEFTPSFLGLRVFFSPLVTDKPKVALSKDCPCSDKVREDFNAWALEMFGANPTFLLVGDRDIYLHPKHKTDWKVLLRSVADNKK